MPLRTPLQQNYEILRENGKNNNEKEEPEALAPFERLFKHATMSSLRRKAGAESPHAPADALDFVMEALFDPIGNTFPEKSDPYLHIETVHKESDPEYNSWRVLRTRPKEVPRQELDRGHPIVYGGVPEKESIFHVALGIPSDHTPQTNPGYSRTPTGSFYSI